MFFEVRRACGQALLLLAFAGVAQAQQQIGALDPETLEREHGEAIAQCPGRAEWVARRDKLAAERPGRAVIAEPSDQKLREELLAMDAADRDARAEYTKKKNADKLDPATEKLLHDAIWKNYFRMKELIPAQGFPTAAEVGQDGVDAAFAIVQHSNMDSQFQARALDLIRKRSDSGEIDLRKLALLSDRVALAQREVQRFGTQFRPASKKLIVLWEVESPAQLDARREKMGLEPMALYACEIEKAYGVIADVSVLDTKSSTGRH